MAASDDVSSSSSTKRSRSKSQSPPAPPAFSLIFIDESERRSSSQIRRDIRSHVRKGSHERQRRLNAAAKARPVDGARKLAQKGREERSDGSSRVNLVPKLQKLNISGPSNSNEDVVVSGPEEEESPSLDSAEMLRQVPWDFPMDSESGTSFGISADVGFINSAGSSSDNDPDSSPSLDVLSSSEESSPATPVPIDRWVFKTTTPYALLLGKDGPVLQMQSNNWPFPRLSNKRPGVCVWMPCSMIPLPKVGPRPSLLRSSKIVPWICNSAEYFSFKEETIRWVNKRLDEDPTHEKTIGGIACLMSWEIARGNIEETALHMDGLARIVTMKGGLKNLCPIKQFCWKIHLIDLTVALLTNTQPRFSDQTPRRPTQFTNHSHQISSSPLCSTTSYFPSFEFESTTSPFCPKTRSLLHEMHALTHSSNSNFSSTLVPSLTLGVGVGGENRGLFRIVQAASNIYRRAFLKIPFASLCNRRDVQVICECLEDAKNDEVWVRYPGVLLWILLVGVAAADGGDGLRSYLTMWFYRVGTTAVWWGVEECTEAVMAFLKVKRLADGEGER